MNESRYANLTAEQRRVVDAVMDALGLPEQVAADKKPEPRPWTVQEILEREG